jgi:mxaD protein
MLKMQTIAGAVLAAGAGVAFAAAPVLNVTKSATVNAPVAKVWDAVKNFDGLNTWHPAVASDQIVEGSNNQVGAVRLLTLKDGGTIKEKLLGYDPAHHGFKYAILEGVLPVSDYTSTVSVKAGADGKSVVTWSGQFKRKDVGDHPAINADDKTAIDTMGAVYRAGLDNLGKMLGGG